MRLLPLPLYHELHVVPGPFEGAVTISGGQLISKRFANMNILRELLLAQSWQKILGLILALQFTRLMKINI